MKDPLKRPGPCSFRVPINMNSGKPKPLGPSRDKPGKDWSQDFNVVVGKQNIWFCWAQVADACLSLLKILSPADVCFQWGAPLLLQYHSAWTASCICAETPSAGPRLFLRRRGVQQARDSNPQNWWLSFSRSFSSALLPILFWERVPLLR